MGGSEVEVRSGRGPVEAVASRSPAREGGEEDRLARLRESFASKARTGSFVTQAEVAAHLSVSVKTVQRIRSEELLRCCVGKGGVRYRPSDVLRFAERSRR